MFTVYRSPGFPWNDISGLDLNCAGNFIKLQEDPWYCLSLQALSCTGSPHNLKVDTIINQAVWAGSSYLEEEQFHIKLLFSVRF